MFTTKLYSLYLFQYIDKAIFINLTVIIQIIVMYIQNNISQKRTFKFLLGLSKISRSPTSS